NLLPDLLQPSQMRLEGTDRVRVEGVDVIEEAGIIDFLPQGPAIEPAVDPGAQDRENQAEKKTTDPASEDHRLPARPPEWPLHGGPTTRPALHAQAGAHSLQLYGHRF